MKLADYWQVVLSASVVAGAAAYLWATIKNQKSKADTDTISSYKEELSILSQKVKRLEEESVIFAADKVKLTAQLRQLELKNEALTAALALRNPDFEEKFTAMVAEIKQLRTDFQRHYDEDKGNFNSITSSITEGYKLMGERISDIKPTLDVLVEVVNKVQNK